VSAYVHVSPGDRQTGMASSAIALIAPVHQQFGL
jgi:hypothetical protein